MRKIYLALFLTPSLYAIDLHDYINSTNCNQLIKHNNYRACYDYSLKNIKYFAYTLNAKKLAKNNQATKSTTQYYADSSIPEKFRSYPEDYATTMYHFGTMLNSQDLSVKTNRYAMTTIVPIESSGTQQIWNQFESYEVSLAKQYGQVNVLDIITYSDKPLRIGSHQIAVPNNIIKVFYNNKKHFKQCFSIHNESTTNISNNLVDYQLSCGMLLDK